MPASIHSTVSKFTSVWARQTKRIARLAGYPRLSFEFSELRIIIAKQLNLDIPIGIIAACYLIVFLPVIPRHTANPQLMAAFVNDEPFLTMALESMAVRPYGNPANYFDLSRTSSNEIPPYWGHLRYPNIFYYGGAMYQVAFPFYVIGRIMGLPKFPTAAIVLRLVCLFSGLGCLIVLYNFFKLRGSGLAGAVAAACILTDPGFIYLVTYIHPDALQIFFGLLALVFGVQHARQGNLASLVGLGIFCGLVQGTKVGGPWLAPMAAFAVALGAHASKGSSGSPYPANTRPSESVFGEISPWKGTSRYFMVRCLFLSLTSAAAFFVSTPYAAVDSFYWRALRSTLAIVAVGSPIGVHPSLLSWASLFFAQIGTAVAVFAALGAVRGIISVRKGATDFGLVLALVVSVSQLLWFGTTGKLWHVISYLLLAEAVVTGIAIETMVEAGRRIRDFMLPPVWMRWRKPVSVAVATLVVFFFFHERWDIAIQSAIALSQDNTVRALGDWAASGGLPQHSKILFDDLAYFDATRFPNARMHGGVLTWPQVELARPDIIVLSSSLYGADWYVKLRETQHYDRWNPDPYSMRLYQDLLRTNEPGATTVPGIELIKIVRPVAHSQENGIIVKLSQAPWLPALAQDTISRVGQIADGLQTSATEPIVGPELRVFRLAPAGTVHGRPAGFAVRSAEGNSPSLAFDGSPNAWRCKEKGDSARMCSVGFDFGKDAAVAVRRLRIRWEAAENTPLALQLEFSDDNVRWTEATALDVTGSVATAETLSEQTFPVPDSGSHRSWRISPLRVREGGGFAVAEMAFLEQ